MQLQEGKRTYSYMVSGVTAGLAASGFPLVDSSGNRMNCNYLEVRLHYKNKNDAGAVAVVYVEPSGTGLTNYSMVEYPTISEEYNSTQVVAGDVSGICGAIISADPRTSIDRAIFKADNGALIDSANIHVHEDFSQKGVIDLILTYGNITPFNTLRLDRYDRGV
jgi:hypothetical protein